MELENTDVQVETVEETVSTVENQEVSEVWTAPTKEDFEKAIKAAENKTYTRALKELGVKSTKEFLEARTKLEQEKTEHDNILKEREDLQTKSTELQNELSVLKQERLFNKLNILEDYRNDLVKLAEGLVTAEKDFETVLTEMSTQDKYQYAFKGPEVEQPKLKMGIEKQNVASKTSTVSETLVKKYPWLKE